MRARSLSRLQQITQGFSGLDGRGEGDLVYDVEYEYDGVVEGWGWYVGTVAARNAEAGLVWYVDATFGTVGVDVDWYAKAEVA